MNGMAAADEETTYFLMDTNFFRYTHSADTAHQIAALDFLVEARKEIERGTAVIVISDEVKCELEVQKHTLSQYNLAIVEEMLDGRHPIISSDLPVYVEHELRIFSNYIRHPKFKDVFTVKPYKHDYLRTSDAPF